MNDGWFKIVVNQNNRVYVCSVWRFIKDAYQCTVWEGESLSLASLMRDAAHEITGYLLRLPK